MGWSLRHRLHNQLLRPDLGLELQGLGLRVQGFRGVGFRVQG